MKSHEKEKASLPRVKKALGKYGSANVEDSTGSKATKSKDDGISISLDQGGGGNTEGKRGMTCTV